MNGEALDAGEKWNEQNREIRGSPATALEGFTPRPLSTSASQSVIILCTLLYRQPFSSPEPSMTGRLLGVHLHVSSLPSSPAGKPSACVFLSVYVCLCVAYACMPVCKCNVYVSMHVVCPCVVYLCAMHVCVICM